MTTQIYDTAFNESGLQKVRAYDITQNVLRDLVNKPIDDGKKEIIQTQILFLIREIIRSFSGMKETDIYNFLKDGRTIYYVRILTKDTWLLNRNKNFIV